MQEPKEKKKNIPPNQGMILGMLLGFATFVALGIATGNLALWMSMGGLSFGTAALSASQAKKKNDEDKPE